MTTFVSFSKLTRVGEFNGEDVKERWKWHHH